ncbi:MAG: exo-alpha-sialidase [Chitinophagaceae bacterium]|nr:exo-alpha-sialidase [Chitinophagaceae bacterium]
MIHPFTTFLKKLRLLALTGIVLACCAGSSMAQNQQLNHLFKQDEDGYKCFRIPAIIATNNGTLLAFAEARKKGCSDTGDIDLVLKRSSDGGKTWGALEVVWNDAENTCGNPVPVVDKNTGNIILLSTWNLGTDHEKDIIALTSKDTRRIFVMKSTDDGRTWSTAREITQSVKKDDWTWYATGPVNGIQVAKGKYKGRLVVPCDHIEAQTKKYYSHAIYSDNGGETWSLGNSTPQDQVNECTVAELSNGDLMLNMRNYNATRLRQVAISRDGGHSWSDLTGDPALIEPVCQGSLLRYKKAGKKALVFSNPASKEKRVNMTVRLSPDNGKTWKYSKVLHEGPSAYSNLVVLPNGNLACFYEAGIKNPYEGIVFQEISLSDIKGK